MTLEGIKELLKAEVLSPNFNLNIEIRCASASDLMSDVLASVEPGELLLTGLTNNQVIRTCEIAGIQAVVFVRGKRPQAETIRMSEQCNIPVLTTALAMFEACGLLYANGLTAVAMKSA